MKFQLLIQCKCHIEQLPKHLVGAL